MRFENLVNSTVFSANFFQDQFFIPDILYTFNMRQNVFQSYIQSFRERQGEGCAYPGARLSGAHTAVDMDYDCGSTVPLTSGAVPNPRV